MSLPSPIIAVLAHFEPLFTAPTWKKVMTLLVVPIILFPMGIVAYIILFIGHYWVA